MVNPSGSSGLYRCVTINFRTDTDTTLTVTYTLEDDHGTSSNISLLAANLDDAAVTTQDLTGNKQAHITLNGINLGSGEIILKIDGSILASPPTLLRRRHLLASPAPTRANRPG